MEKLVIYTTEDNKTEIQVKFDDETVWLTQSLLADLFQVKIPTINEHLKNIFEEQECDRDATIRKFLIVRKEGVRSVNREIEHYNLDVILSIGYRVKSKVATQFRQWATQRLKDYLVDGYAINKKRLEEREYEVKILKTGIQILNTTLREHVQTIDEARGLAILLEQFEKGLTILDDYDHEALDKKGNHSNEALVIEYDAFKSVINAMRTSFSSDIFGQEKDGGFKSAIQQIYQSFGGQDLYKSLEEKAATLLYLIVKNHAFVDGNKRIAAACFLYFLDKNNIDPTKSISNDGLASLTLFIAASKPEDMKVAIQLIISILNRA